MKKIPISPLIRPVNNVKSLSQMRNNSGQSLFTRNDVTHEVLFANLPGVVYWKNDCSQYLGGNQAFLKLAALENENELVGRTDFTMPWVISAGEMIRDDRHVLSLAPNAEYESTNIISIAQSFNSKSISLQTIRKHIVYNSCSIILAVVIAKEL